MTTFVGCWPILDDELTLDELVAEADEVVVGLAWQHGVVLLEVPTWETREGRIEGNESPTGVYLCCAAEARPHDYARSSQVPGGARS